MATRTVLALLLACACLTASRPPANADEANEVAGASGGEAEARSEPQASEVRKPPEAARSEPQASEVHELDCAEAVALRVQAHYDAVQDLTARFRQTTERVALGSMGGAALEAAGEVVFAKPGRMRWSYETPEPSLVVSDGESMWIYDPGMREAQHLPLGPELLSGAAIQFLLGEGRVLEQFAVSTTDCDADPIRLDLAPRADAPYERLEMVAEPRTGLVVETTVVDLFGNRTRVALEQVRTNTSPGDALFEFVPPEGTRVLELPPAPAP
ncbi:MAG: outer membrane lipoprotein carrier protein LolA [Myxococcota bacterium]|nr:outer membrane lipoprotein carrier protein LolA [Myxococcota bacterium]